MHATEALLKLSLPSSRKFWHPGGKKFFKPCSIGLAILLYHVDPNICHMHGW